MGETFPTFQSIGSDSVSMDNWNSCASGSASTWRISLNTRGCILSGPGDLDGFNFSSFFSTLSAVMFIYSRGVKYGLGSKAGMLVISSCVNTEEKNAFIKLALSLGSVMMRPSSSFRLPIFLLVLSLL